MEDWLLAVVGGVAFIILIVGIPFMCTRHGARARSATGSNAALAELPVTRHASDALPADKLAERLAAYYARHVPDSVDKVPAVLAKYSSDPTLLRCLFADLDAKYGTSEATPEETRARLQRDANRGQRACSATATV
jgi:hypothetical protein